MDIIGIAALALATVPFGLFGVWFQHDRPRSIIAFGIGVFFLDIAICAAWLDKTWKQQTAQTNALQALAQADTTPDKNDNALNANRETAKNANKTEPSRQHSEIVKNQNESSIPTNENKIFNFRLLSFSGSKAEIEVSYVYDGKLGLEGIGFDAYLLRNDGTRLGGGPTYVPEILTANSKMMTTFEFVYQPKKPERSSRIRICMSHWGKGVEFCIAEFPLRKLWKPNSGKQQP